MKVAIAGASGFIGRALIDHIIENTDWSIIALSRGKKASTNPRIEWRQADMFSLLEVEKGLKGANKAFYLVHSMMPSAQLDQGSFEDYDLLLAENFALAAEKVGLEHLIYLGGIFPENKKLSSHLRSRREVEEVFKDRSFSTSNARAGLIVGEGGSSFQIMFNLIDHLPVLACPSWTQNPMTPIDRTDAVSAIVEMATGDLHKNKTYEIGGPQTFTYFELLKICAQKMQKARLFIKVPLPIMAFSKLWVRLFSGASKELVYPLLDSLKMPMAIHESKRFPTSRKQLSYEESLDQAIKSSGPKSYTPAKYNRDCVRSVQRMDLPTEHNVTWVAEEYMRWLPRFLTPFIRVNIIDNLIRFCLLQNKWVMLELTYSPERSSNHRRLFYITGGLLTKTHDRGRLEFRKTHDQKSLLVAIHDFYPSIPWFIYRYTQAILHLWVMGRFSKHLRKSA